MPGFTFVSKDHKLDAGDAQFVDVIHTNAFLQGTIQSSGHVDFYMNGGVIQPGCWAENRKIINILQADASSDRSHHR